MTPQDLYRDMHTRPDWQNDALCAQIDPELWYPEKGQNASPAKRLCMACPVQPQCLQDALDRHEEHGIWGGHTSRERKLLRRGEHVTPNLHPGGPKPAAA